MDAGFANIPGDAWDAFDGLKLASPLANTSSSTSSFTPDQNVLMDDLLNLEGLPDSGHNMSFDLNWNNDATTFDATTLQPLPSFLDFDPSSMDFNLAANDDIKSFTCPLFNDVQVSSWVQ